MNHGSPEMPVSDKREISPLIPNIELSEEEVMERNTLQIGWFMHRCEGIQNEDELDATLKRLVQDDPSLTERVERSAGNKEEKVTILLESMINTPLGNAELAWFRMHFPNDKSKPLAHEYAMVLDLFVSGDVTKANEELDRLFRESTSAH